MGRERGPAGERPESEDRSVSDILTSVISAIIQHLGAYPILLFLIIMGIAPWAAMIWAQFKQDKRLARVFERQDQRFEEVVRMYESNVQLVQAYQTVTQNYHEITDNLQQLVMLTTQTQERLVGKIETNRYCPLVRQRTGPGNIEENAE